MTLDDAAKYLPLRLRKEDGDLYIDGSGEKAIACDMQYYPWIDREWMPVFVEAVNEHERLSTLNARLREALEFISDGLHKAANGGFTGAGEKLTVGKLKSLIRNYHGVAAEALKEKP